MIAALALFVAQPPASISQELEAFRTQNHIAGLSAAVWQGGRQQYAQAFGFRDVAGGQAAGVSDLYRLASVSKPITAIGMMSLVEDGRLELDSPAAKWLKDLPAGHSYTVRQLLCHTAGITHYRGPSDPTTACFDHFPALKSACLLFIHSPLLSPPGEKYSYSTHGYTLAGAVLESATGMRFANYMRRRVMTYAGPGGLDCENLAEPPKPNRTSLYRASQSGPVAETKREDLSWKYPGGGMEATAPGLARFGDALMAGKVVKQSSLQQLWTRQKTNDGKEIGYGLGFDINADGTRLHTGAQQGARTVFYIDPANKLTVVVLCNTSGNFDMAALAKSIAARYQTPLSAKLTP
ncbi:MAG: beta-lactamase family protein [Armatimonadetes bacterium]|nr:beta-lactamase family protein [Armatimonadota bacterium]